MKKKLIILVLVLAIAKLYGQEYYVIDFVGEGATIESIYVENLTQGTNVVMSGTDVLHLILTSTVINHQETERKQIKIYPNPTNQTCNIEFTNKKEGNVQINLCCIAGKQILNLNENVSEGAHNLSINQLPAGIYVINIETKTDLFSGRIISTGKAEICSNITTSIDKNENISISKPHNIRKSIKSIVQMDYEIGDQLKFIGYAEGFEPAITIESPTNDSTYSLAFTLFECGGLFADFRDLNIYQTVEIGEQCWMAENLAYLPNVVGFDSTSITEPLYYVYDYNGTNVSEANSLENYNNYGVLYNWAAANSSCPPGWRLPSYSVDMMELVDYIQSLEWTVINHSGQYLKSCRQIDSPLEGICNTNEHPRWDFNDTHFGTDDFGFAVIPGGCRGLYEFENLGIKAHFWAIDSYGSNASNLVLTNNHYWIDNYDWYSGKIFGFSVRCIKE